MKHHIKLIKIVTNPLKYYYLWQDKQAALKQLKVNLSKESVNNKTTSL
jgi:hypothetical protein